MVGSILILIAAQAAAASPNAAKVEEPRCACEGGPVAEPARSRVNLPSLVADSDYPASALRDREQGTVGFRLTVSSEGRVSNCVVTSSSGSSALDAASCRIMRSRARFTPARNATGGFTTDTVNSRLSWTIRAPLPPHTVE
jgi:protein TonB